MWVIMIYMFVLLIIAQKKNKAAAKTTTTTATVTVQVRQAEVSQWEFSCHYVFPDEIVKRITSTNTFRK